MRYAAKAAESASARLRAGAAKEARAADASSSAAEATEPVASDATGFRLPSTSVLGEYEFGISYSPESDCVSDSKAGSPKIACPKGFG